MGSPEGLRSLRFRLCLLALLQCVGGQPTIDPSLLGGNQQSGSHSSPGCSFCRGGPAECSGNQRTFTGSIDETEPFSCSSVSLPDGILGFELELTSSADGEICKIHNSAGQSLTWKMEGGLLTIALAMAGSSQDATVNITTGRTYSVFTSIREHGSGDVFVHWTVDDYPSFSTSGSVFLQSWQSGSHDIVYGSSGGQPSIVGTVLQFQSFTSHYSTFTTTNAEAATTEAPVATTALAAATTTTTTLLATTTTTTPLATTTVVPATTTTETVTKGVTTTASTSTETATTTLTVTASTVTKTSTSTLTETATTTLTTTVTVTATTSTGTTVTTTVTVTSTRTSTRTTSTTRTETETSTTTVTHTETSVTSTSSSVTTSQTSSSTTSASTQTTVTTSETSTLTTATTLTLSTTSSVTVSSTTATVTSTGTLPPADVAAHGVITDGVQLFGPSLVEKGQVSSTQDTRLGALKVVNVGATVSGTRVQPVTVAAEGGSKVFLPAAVVGSLPEKTILAVLSFNKGEGSFDYISDREPSSALDVSLCKLDGDCGLQALSAPLLIRMPDDVNQTLPKSRARCVYLEQPPNGGAPYWSERGVRKASPGEVAAIGQEDDGVWCVTTHLSIFAVFFDALFGCTNIELLSGDAISQVVERKGWTSAGAPQIVFGISCMGFFLMLLGAAWEWFSLRNGRTHDGSKKVKLCANLVKLGPQLVKHKYTVFVVYAKDAIQCVRTPSAQLRNSTLAAGVQRVLAVRNGVSNAVVAAHCWQHAGWADTKPSVSAWVLQSKLSFHCGVAERVVERFQTGFYWMVVRFFAAFLALHPLLDSMRVGAGSMTVMKRMTLQAAGLFGVLATNALIFNFNGDLRDWEADAECPISPTSNWFIFVASLVSLLCNALPNAQLADLGKQVYGRPGWTAVFWGLSLSYLSFAVFFVLVALANLNEKDQRKWYKSLEWSMSIKFLGMPAAQALRHSLVQEYFLIQERRADPSEAFIFASGLRHPLEVLKAVPELRALAASDAKRWITLEELVKFTALLGSKVMPDFDMRLSTTQEVLEKGIRPCCIEPPPLDMVRIEVLEYYEGELSNNNNKNNNKQQNINCAILHLGKKEKSVRPCIGECKSESMRPTPREGGQRCRWAHFEGLVYGLQLEHAVGFFVSDGGKLVGIAWLSAQELLEGGAEQREVALAHPMPYQVHSWNNINALENPDMDQEDLRVKTGEQGRLIFKVHIPQDMAKNLAQVERSRLRSLDDERVTDAAAMEMQDRILKEDNSRNEQQLPATRPFCEPRMEGAAGKVVVHSMSSIFSQLVASVVADALHYKGAYREVHDMLLEGKFGNILEVLRKAEVQDSRYWMSIFAASHQEPEQIFKAMPSILRALRQNACEQKIADIQSRKPFDKGCPFWQLVILDKQYGLLRESEPLAEMMLAKGLRMQQRLNLTPDHLDGARLGEELSKFGESLGGQFNSREKEWAAPYLKDKQGVYDTLRDLTVIAVKEQREDSEETWKELSMTNVYATIAAVQASRASAAEAEGLEDVGAIGDGGDGGD